MLKIDTTKKIAVIGDVMVDEYYIGDVTRMSPEAPVPIVALKQRYATLGGAANVAVNLKSLGYEPILLSVVGNSDSDTFMELMDQYGIDTGYIVFHNDRITTTKTRVMGNNNHICRVDREITTPIDIHTADNLRLPLDVDAIIISDYAKGICTPYLIHKRLMGFPGIVVVDPKKELAQYKGVDVIKPNRREALELSGETDVDQAAKYLFKQLKPKNVIVTMGEYGANIYRPEKTVVPAYKTDVVDITGAGDTFTAVLTACMTSGLGVVEATKIANMAASMVITKLGVSTVSLEDLVKRVESNG